MVSVALSLTKKCILKYFSHSKTEVTHTHMRTLGLREGMMRFIPIQEP